MSDQNAWEQGKEEKTEAKYTTRHGSHLTKTSEGTEEQEEEKQ